LLINTVASSQARAAKIPRGGGRKKQGGEHKD